MGYVAVKRKVRDDLYSNSLALSFHPDNRDRARMSRGMTINPKATVSYMKLTTHHHEEYVCLPQDYDCASSIS